MTSTLPGRWHTRLLLTAALGIPVALGFSLFVPGLRTYLVLLGAWLLFGLLMDLAYHALQSLRWDRDWPFVFSLVGGVLEIALLWGLLNAALQWVALSFPRYLAFVALVWLLIQVAHHGPLKVLFPRRRFRGGQLW